MKKSLFLCMLISFSTYAASEGCPRNQDLHELKENFNLTLVATRDLSSLDLGFSVPQENGATRYYMSPDFGNVKVSSGQRIPAIVSNEHSDWSDPGYEIQYVDGVISVDNELMRFSFSRNGKDSTPITVQEFENAVDGSFRLVCSVRPQRHESSDKAAGPASVITQ